MKSTSKKTALDIAKWYDIEKYKAVATFTRRDWYANLSFRAVARAVIFPKRFRDDTLPVKQRQALADFAWETIRDNPIIQAPFRTDVVPAFPGMDSPLDEVTTLLSLPTVRPLALSDLVRTRKRDGVRRALDIWKRLPPGFASTDQVVTRAQDLATLHQALDQPDKIEDSRVRLVVDLAASNEKLFDDFKIWLDRARKVYRGKRDERSRHTVSDHLVGQWVRKNILGYLDIMLWVRLSERKVSDVDWPRLLDPIAYDYSVRTKRDMAFDLESADDKAKKAISDENLAALYRDIL